MPNRLCEGAATAEVWLEVIEALVRQPLLGLPRCASGEEMQGDSQSGCALVDLAKGQQPARQPTTHGAAAASAIPARCAKCGLLQEHTPDGPQIIDLLVQCRALREFARPSVAGTHSSHVIALVLTPNGRVIESNQRGQSFLRTGSVMCLLEGQLCCTDAGFRERFTAALRETANTGRTTNLLLHAPGQADQRFSLTLARTKRPVVTGAGTESAGAAELLCLIAPLDHRRVATARQLMDLFGLSGAEARLARALCQGDSVDEYARDEGLRLPTVRTQLSSVLNKTGTDRQATLVRLIASIPVVREST